MNDISIKELTAEYLQPYKDFFMVGLVNGERKYLTELQMVLGLV